MISNYVRIEKNAEGIATIWLDIQGEKMNIVSPQLIDAFDEIFKDLIQDNTVKGIVLISGKKDFIAGADIKAFKADKKGDFLPTVKKGHTSLNFIEASKKPIVSAIHGTCYGLGVELSLACTARIASDDASTKLALPEVKLGLLPGGGGSNRLPRLVGAPKSLDMMLTGKNIFARQALKMGLVDELVNKEKLHSAAIALVHKINAGKFEQKRKRTLLEWFLESTSIGRNIVYKQARKTVYKTTYGNYPAPLEIINVVEYSLKNGMEKGLNFEAEKFEELMIGQTSKELIGLFFAMGDNKKNPYTATPNKVENMGIIGAGFMGSGIAEVSVPAGIRVRLKDIKQEMLTAAKQTIWKSYEQKIKRKITTKTAAENQFNNINTQLDNTGFERADMIIEAVVERMDVKKNVIAELEKLPNEKLIIASNTSSLSLTEMSSAAQRPEQIVGMHYFSPVPKMPLLEIVKTTKTAEWVLATCYETGVRQGKTCIVVNDGAGFYVNRILAPYINECLLMLEEGISIEAIDTAMKKKGFPVGPMQLLDEVGIDVVGHIMKSSGAEIIKGRAGFKQAEGILKMFDAGYYGKKNKKGFYTYDEKTGKKTGVNTSAYSFFGANGTKTLDEKIIQDRGFLLMLNEAVMCLQEGIIANEGDGNIGAIFGIGFPPFTGGPFRYIQNTGAQNVLARMQELRTIYGDKFIPCEKWNSL